MQPRRLRTIMRAMQLNDYFRYLVAKLLLGACLGLPAIAAAANPTPPPMRLGEDVQPLAYELAVTLVPDAPGFTGRIDIDVDLRRPLDFFWMNARGLEIQSARHQGGQDAAGRDHHGR